MDYYMIRIPRFSRRKTFAVNGLVLFAALATIAGAYAGLEPRVSLETAVACALLALVNIGLRMLTTQPWRFYRPSHDWVDDDAPGPIFPDEPAPAKLNALNVVDKEYASAYVQHTDHARRNAQNVEVIRQHLSASELPGIDDMPDEFSKLHS